MKRPPEEGIFTLKSSTISIGDGTMEFARYPVDLPEGLYRLVRGALLPARQKTRESQLISLDSPYVFAFDGSVEAMFDEVYHEIAGPVSYDITRVLERKAEMERRLGSRIGFYWEAELSKARKNREGEYTLDLNRVEAAKE